MFNIAKNINGETTNKLTTSKLIAYNDKIPTNNMINSKSLKYSCDFRSTTSTPKSFIESIIDCS